MKKFFFKKSFNKVITTINLLAISDNICEDSNVLKVFYFIGTLLKSVFFIIPILLILMLIIDFAKNIIANNAENMNKNLQIAIKRILMTVSLFLLPTIVSFLSTIIDGFEMDIKYADCLTNANLDTIAAYQSKEELEITKEDNTMYIEKEDKKPELITNNYNSKIGNGKGPIKDIDIKYNIKDTKGRCGKGANDYCAAIATVKYENETIKYYMGYQNNSGLLVGSCRSHAFISVTNAIKNTNYSTLDLQKYLYSTGNRGVLKAKGLDKAIKEYKLKATVFHSEISKKNTAKLMKKALDNGQPVMIFVSHDLCSDIAGSHHALLVLGYDEKGNAIFIDSVPYAKKAKKRSIEELAQCISGKSISDSYYRMIIFSFD